MRIRNYNDSASADWDAFVARSSSGTFLHTRRYLSYHQERFKDVSLIVEDDDGSILGVLPAALAPQNPRWVVSHPGITYGGLLHAGKLKGEQMILALEMVCQNYAAAGYETLTYKAVPYIYHRPPASDDLYALFRLRAVRFRCDLSCAIDLQHRGAVSSRRIRSLEKARKQGVTVREGVELASLFWPILAENLARKHGLKPVHSLEEILLLHSRFPESIAFVVAFVGDQAVAGTTLYETDIVSHAQYIGSSELGQATAALDATFDYCITRALAKGRRYFDFGVSTVEDGNVLNTGLNNFKSEFGGGGVTHEFYRINLPTADLSALKAD